MKITVPAKLGVAAVAVAALAVPLVSIPALSASAANVALRQGTRAGAAVATASATANPAPNVSSTAASAWQTNDTVWALAYAKGVVFVGGQFTSVRPPGDAVGTGEVARTFLAAFSSTTGNLITSFDPVITGTTGSQVSALTVSPDGNTLYVGGKFQHVNGSYRDNLAAFNISNISSITLSTTWTPSAYGKVNSVAVAPDGSEIYLAGDFNTVDGVARTYAAAVTPTGTLMAWNPALDGSLTSVAVAPDDSRVLIGGNFNTVNGLSQRSIASTNPTTGANEPWAAAIIPDTQYCQSAVKDIIVNGTTAYVAAEGTGGGCFDGDFAANISDGALLWQNDCLGATQALEIVNGWLFKGSHAHDCSFAPGGFPQVNDRTGHVTHHLLDQSLADGSLGHWTPNTSSPSGGLGPRAMATDGTQLFVGGDFTGVNGVSQQGFVRFPAGPDPHHAVLPGAPVATSTSAGVVSVSIPATHSRSVGRLTYYLYRDGGTTPIATLHATSWPWATPVLRYRDANLTPGSSHTYRVTVSDGNHTSIYSAASAPVVVALTSPSLTYRQTVLNGRPSFFWPLSETSGTTANDLTGNGYTGIYKSGTTQGVHGPITGTSQTATSFDGSAGLVTAANKVTGPQRFSIEAWFKTSTNTGGSIVGFGNTQTGMPSSYDREIYMMNDGQLVFGVYNSGAHVIETPRVYNDGKWHYVVATMGPHGMTFYVDGQYIGRNGNSVAQSYSGYWRVGSDNLHGKWNLDEWVNNSQGTTEPYSYFFKGTIGDVAVYPSALSAAQVAAHYAANALEH